MDVAVPLAFRHLRLLFEAPVPVALPEFAGSAWRGVLGHGLREAACVTNAAHCTGCPLAGACAYFTLFESPATSGEFGHNTQAPHVFTLHAPRMAPAASRRHALGLTVFGEDEHPLRWLVEGLRRGAQRGVGKQRARLRLVAVEQLTDAGWHPIGLDMLAPLPCQVLSLPQPPAVPLRVVFETPLRMKHANALLDAEHFTPLIWLRALARRIADLSRLYDNGRFVYSPGLAQELDVPDHALQWVELERYSNRQGARHKTGGLMGHFHLPSEAVATYWPLLWTGQFAHVGKLTTLGHGSYRLTPQACHRPLSQNPRPNIHKAESSPAGSMHDRSRLSV